MCTLHLFSPFRPKYDKKDENSSYQYLVMDKTLVLQQNQVKNNNYMYMTCKCIMSKMVRYITTDEVCFRKIG